MNDETKRPAVQNPPEVQSKGVPIERSETNPAVIDRRRLVLTALKGAPIIATLGVTAGRAQAAPAVSTGASSHSSLQTDSKKKKN